MLDPTTFFQMSVSTRTRGHPYKLYKQRHSKRVRDSFFSQRVVNVWNFLPTSIVNFCSLNSFIRTIKEVDLTVFKVFKKWYCSICVL